MAKWLIKFISFRPAKKLVFVVAGFLFLLLYPQTSLALCTSVSFTKPASVNIKESLVPHQIDVSFYPNVGAFHYEIIVNNATYTGDYDVLTTNISPGQSKTVTIDMPNKTASYNVSVVTTDSNGCQYTDSAIVSIEEYVSSTGLSVSASPSTIKFNSGPVKITYNISGRNSSMFKVYVTAQDGTEWQKEGGNVTSDNFSGSFDWTPQEDPGTGTSNRTVKLEVSDGSLSPPAVTTTTIEVVGSQSTATGEDVETQTNFDLSQIWSGFSIKTPTNITGLGGIVARIVQLLVELIGALAVLGIVIGGIQYITSGGDPSKAEKAKKTLLYSIIGLVLAILSLTITIVIINTASHGV